MPSRPLCSTCIHFTHPGQWSARCALIAYDESKSGDWNVAWTTRRADNTCAQHDARAVFEAGVVRKEAA